MLAGDRHLTQDDIDRAARLLHERRPARPRRRASRAVTVRLVPEALRDAGEPRTAAEVADRARHRPGHRPALPRRAGRDGTAEMRLRYGATGRPEHRYRWIGPSE